MFDLLEIRGPRDRIFKQLDRLEPLARSGSPGAHDDPGGPAGATARVLEAPARPVEIVLLDDRRDGLCLAQGVGLVVRARSRSRPSGPASPGRSALEGLAFAQRRGPEVASPIELRSPRTGLLASRPPARRRLAGRQTGRRSRRWPRRCRSCSERDRTDPADRRPSGQGAHARARAARRPLHRTRSRHRRRRATSSTPGRARPRWRVWRTSCRRWRRAAEDLEPGERASSSASTLTAATSPIDRAG